MFDKIPITQNVPHNQKPAIKDYNNLIKISELF